jgi:hypothetical protein
MSKGLDPKVYFIPEGSPVAPDRFDARIRLRSMTRGMLPTDDLAKHLKNLPDDAAHGDVRDYTEVTGGGGDADSSGDLN